MRWVTRWRGRRQSAPARKAGQDLAAEAEAQALRLELADRDRLIGQLQADLRRERDSAASGSEGLALRERERLIAVIATPLVQLATLAQLDGVDARAMVAAARSLLRALAGEGVDLIGQVAAVELYNPGRHEPLGDAVPAGGGRVVVRAPGLACGGVVLRRAGVEPWRGGWLMAGRLAVDFGTSNTVVAVWDHGTGAGVPLAVPDYALLTAAGDREIPVIPSVIHYAQGGRRLVGDQVRQHNLGTSAGTFRWMKQHVARRSPAKVRADGRLVSYFDAGRDFLSAVLAYAAAEAGAGDEEVALAVPVEAFEHYQDWIATVAAAAGLARFRLIDEASAAALGCGAAIRPGSVYLLFDFGGGTLDVAVVLIGDEDGGGRPACRVLGKAGAELGGASIDGWLFAEVLRRAGRSDDDEDVRGVSRAVLAECERAKETLSARDRAEVSVQDPRTGTLIVDAEVTRADLEDLLDQNAAYAQIHQVISRAIGHARERGYDQDAITAVLPVGGSSLIPSVQRTLRGIFGRDRVLLGHPIDAVARGAAAFVAGAGFYDHIQHDYAIRWLNPASGGYDYQMLVGRGTEYPGAVTPEDRPFTIKATYDGQAALGIAIFELGDARLAAGAGLELVFDPTGAARLTEVLVSDEEDRARFWMNEASPTFLTADPPARRGEDCFAVWFAVDGTKRLTLTARDRRTGRLTHRDYPVVKLT